MLTSRLPTLKTSTLKAKNDTRDQLGKLPKSMADNPQSHLLSLFRAFFKDVEDYTSGYPSYSTEQETFSQEARMYYQQLQRAIQRTKPEFHVQEAMSPASKSENQERIVGKKSSEQDGGNSPLVLV